LIRIFSIGVNLRTVRTAAQEGERQIEDASTPIGHAAQVKCPSAIRITSRGDSHETAAVILVTQSGDDGHSTLEPSLRTCYQKWYMAQHESDLLELLKFELKFIEDGGYRRSPHMPWRSPLAFEDSPTCLNFRDPARPHPCTECLLMRFVPSEFRDQVSPCRLIPLTDKGESIDYFYRSGTQLELEEALAGWLRKQVSQIEEQREADHSTSTSNGIDRLRQQQWLAFAGNLFVLANLHREYHNYVVAHALYGHALAAAEKVAAIGDNGRCLVERIRKNQQAISEKLYGGERGVEQAPSEELQMAGR
jgi:hypothetical protein